MGKFSSRSNEIEIMDDLNCSGEVVHKTLNEIEFINRWLGGNAITLGAIESLLETGSQERIRIADLGCGGGGMLREVRDLCRKKNIKCELYGFDANPYIIEFAKEDNSNLPEIHFETLDIFSEEYANKEFDIILCTLVAHHFSNEQLIQLFRVLKSQAGKAVIINDLQRNILAYYSIKILTQLFSKSKMVKFDAPLSVLRGFTSEEIKEIMNKAGISDYQLTWRWAFRYELIF